MQAVVLAAGKGSRLHPITTDRSKAMMPIAGKPMVERVMDGLAANGADDFILVVSPDDREIQNYFWNRSKFDQPVRFVQQPERLGMADALGCAAPLVQGDFLLSACDNLVAEAQIGEMVAAWQGEMRPNAVLALMPMPHEKLSSTGVVRLEGGWITQIIEKPAPGTEPSNIVSLPLYCLPHTILDYLPEVSWSPRGELELQDAIQMLIERKGKVMGVMVERRLTLTRPSDLLEINREYLAKNSHDQTNPNLTGGDFHITPPVFIADGVQIGLGCRIGPYVTVEQDCCIGANVTLQDAILLRGAVAPDRAVIVNGVIGSNGE